MNATAIITRESRRGGWDAFTEVAGLRFQGHGGTPAEAEADLREQIGAFQAVQAEVAL